MDCLGGLIEVFAFRLVSRRQCLQPITVFLLPSSPTAMARLPDQPVLGSARLTRQRSVYEQCAAQRRWSAVWMTRSSGTKLPGHARNFPTVTGPTPPDHWPKNS